MASNLEKMRAKKAQNKTTETTVTASYSIDPLDVKISVHDNNDSVDSINKVNGKSKNPQNQSNSKENSKIKIPKASKEPINNIKAITDDVGNSPEKSLGLRLASEEDKRYLNMAPLRQSVTKKAFFMNLVYEELNSESSVDLYDPVLEEFRNSSLKTAAITIAVPETLIVSIKELAAKHMMKYQRYLAYVIYKARKNDSSWQ